MFNKMSNAIILTLDWCKTPKGPGTFRAGVGIQNDPIYKEAITHLIKHSIASYIPDEKLKTSIISLLDSQSRLQILDLTIPTNNSILSHIEDNRKPSLLEFVLYKMRLFTQSYSKKKFAARLLERNEVDRVMENLLQNPNYDKETYETLKQRAKEIDDEDLKVQLELNKDFIATKEDRGSKIFLTLESAKKGYHEIHKLQKGPLVTVTDPALHAEVIHQNITTNVHEINDILVDTFQDIYTKQEDLKSSEQDIINFLNCDNDTRPYEELKRRRDKVPKELFKKMEGELTDNELHYALFEHMNGSSSPGVDGFTVNHLRVV